MSRDLASPDASSTSHDGSPAVLPLVSNAVDELATVSGALDERQLSTLARAVMTAQAIHLSGAGRSGLMSRAVAMRLMHIGLNAFAVGEVATPAITSGDLLVVFSARGSGSIAAQVQKAAGFGATTAALSSAIDTDVARLCDHVVVIPARTSVPTVQHAGSLFEQACLLVGDALCRAVQTALQVPTSALDARHANLS